MTLSQSGYFPTLEAEKDIRIFTIHPGRNCEPIQGDVHVSNLADARRQPYNTLSYVWGKPQCTKTIKIRAKDVPVTDNLFDALLHIRSPVEPIAIWVDAICINQQDDAEKSSQIALMSEVYKRCKQVLIWLGCPPEENMPTIDPFTIINHFAKNKHFYQLPKYEYDSSTKSWSCLSDDADFVALWNAFRPVAESPWWTRAWTVQEAILPSKATLLYGSYSTSWSAVLAEQRNKVEHWKWCCGAAWLSTPRTITDILDNFNFQVETLKKTQKRSKGFATFHDCVRNFQGRSCLDPRDKVYCHLGVLSPSAIRGLQADYTKSICQVWMEASVIMMRELDWNPRFLLGTFGYNCTELGIPSWMKNLTDVRSMKIQLRRVFSTYPVYNASRKRGKIRFSRQLYGGCLHLDAVCIDIVKDHGVVNNPEHATLNIFKEWTEVCQRNEIAINTTSLDARFARLICADLVENKGRTLFKRCKRRHLPSDSAWEHLMRGDNSLLSEKFRSGMEAALNWTKLFVTESGRLGLGAEGVEVGDMIFIVAGAKVPFVLRESTEVSSVQAPRRFVGEAFLEEAMDGQFSKTLVTKGKEITLV